MRVTVEEILDPVENLVRNLHLRHFVIKINEINESNVLAAIKKLKNNYTSGPDGLTPLFFKRLQHVIVKLLQLFTISCSL